MIDPAMLHRNVPSRLQELPQWVCWNYIERDGRKTKCPINARNGKSASSTDAATWSTFDQAIATCRVDDDLAGIGFVFTADDQFAGIDLDKCVDSDTDALKSWALPILERLDSYCEISPSGTGVKVFLRAVKSGSRCKTRYEDGAVEMYDRGRFFTMTGVRLPQYSGCVEERQEAFDSVYATVLGNSTEHDTQRKGLSKFDGQPMADDEIIRLALSHRRSGTQFNALWNGRWQDLFGSQSEADSSLAYRIAYYTKVPIQIDRIFRRSHLMRAKWDEKHGAQTYGEMTIAAALTNVKSQYAPRNPASGKRLGTRSDGRLSVPEIVTSDVQLRELTAQAVEALVKSNDPPTLFVRSGSLVRITEDEERAPKIETLERIRMRSRLSDVANFYVLKRSGDAVLRISVTPPLPLAENILVQGNWPFPPLAGLARAPIVRPDGTLCVRPGYDARTGLLYAPDPDLRLLAIPELPNIHEVHACVDILLRVIDDFPFADQASKANALSILFSVLLRPVIRGHIPLAIFDAPVQGTGKTLLVSVLVWIAVGSIAIESVPSKLNDDEWRKKITSVLMTSAPVILLDNVPDNTAIDSPALAAALTSHEWSDRLLGKNETIRRPSKAIWIATGNNLRVAGDIPRRSYVVRLDAQAERPWERNGFQITDLEAYVRDKRGELLSAALTVIRGWFSAQCPRENIRPFGSFDEWAGVVGGVLGYAGIHGFLDNLDQTRSVQDEEGRQWAAVFDAWWHRFGERRVTVAELHAAFFAECAPDPVDPPDSLLEQKGHGDGSLRRSLGRHLSRLTGRVFGGRKLHDAGGDSHAKVRAWVLKGVEGTRIELNNPANPALCGVIFSETPQRE